MLFEKEKHISILIFNLFINLIFKIQIIMHLKLRTLIFFNFCGINSTTINSQEL